MQNGTGKTPKEESEEQIKKWKSQMSNSLFHCSQIEDLKIGLLQSNTK